MTAAPAPSIQMCDICSTAGCRRSFPPSTPSTTLIESQVNEADRTRLFWDTRSHLCGSDSSAVAAIERPRRSGRPLVASRRAPPEASGPPGSQSGARRKRGPQGSPRTLPILKRRNSETGKIPMPARHRRLCHLSPRNNLVVRPRPQERPCPTGRPPHPLTASQDQQTRIARL